jgi:hypothetical protein
MPQELIDLKSTIEKWLKVDDEGAHEGDEGSA